eukprot:g23437.t1
MFMQIVNSSDPKNDPQATSSAILDNPFHCHFPYDDGIAATASVLNTTNCQFPDAILQLIHFILNHNVFTFDNQFSIQGHGTAMGIRFSPQYANIFMHRRGHLSNLLYRKPMDNLTMLHFSASTLNIKTAIPYRQVLCIHRTCLDEEEWDGQLKVLKGTLKEKDTMPNSSITCSNMP